MLSTAKNYEASSIFKFWMHNTYLKLFFCLLIVFIKFRIQIKSLINKNISNYTKNRSIILFYLNDKIHYFITILINFIHKYNTY